MKKYTITITEEQLDIIRFALNAMATLTLGQTFIQGFVAKGLVSKFKHLLDYFPNDLTDESR